MKFICSKCGHEEDFTTRKPRCDCGGLWKLKFTPPPFDDRLIDKNTWNIFRYRKFMPLIDDSWQKVTLGEGLTPIIRYDDNILLKMDYYMPTLSFKDRGAAVLIAHCKSISVESVIQDSSGNAGNSVAAYCGHVGISCEIFVPEGVSDTKIHMIKAHGAKISLVPSNRDHCAEVCREKVRREGIYYANHVFNPIFYEGTKTFIYETFEQLGHIPGNIFIPVGNGTLFIGIMKGLEELLAAKLIKKFPQVVILQSERCQPIVKAIERGENDISTEKVFPTMAKGLAIGVPIRSAEILDYIYRHKVKAITIPEEKILPARIELAKHGIYCEHTTASVYAGYKNWCEHYGKPAEVLIPMCGAGLKSYH